jgi:hypothetical protein
MSGVSEVKGALSVCTGNKEMTDVICKTDELCCGGIGAVVPFSIIVLGGRIVRIYGLTYAIDFLC